MISLVRSVHAPLQRLSRHRRLLRQSLHGKSLQTISVLLTTKLYVDVENCVKENKFNLIEALAEKISNDIMLKYTVVESSVVRVRKPFAPIKGIFDNIEFEIVKKRNDYE